MNRERLSRLDALMAKIFAPSETTEVPDPKLDPAPAAPIDSGGVHAIMNELRSLDSEDLLLDDLGAVTAASNYLMNVTWPGRGVRGTPEVWDALSVIRDSVHRALSAHTPAPQSRFPQFVDRELAEILERDLLNAEDCASRFHWKSCVVLCGSILEAALYERLRRDLRWTMDPARQHSPHHRKGSAKDISSNEEAEGWKLDELIRFACGNGILDPALEGTLHHLLRNPRNLIHPAAELRKEHRVDRETAEACLATVKLALKALH